VTIESFMFIVLSIRFFFMLINDTKISKLTDFYLFWLNTAVLIYFCGNFLVFLFTDFIFYNKEGRNLWILHSIFNTVYNVLLCKTIYTWKKVRQ